MDRPRILVLTGDGKGKTTSALGMVLRALGHGGRVLFVRFCKTAESGELAALAHFVEGGALVILAGDRGFTPAADHPDFPLHVACARGLFACVGEEAAGFGMIVLDEICGAVARGLLSEGDVLGFLAALRPDQCVVLTGRNASARLVDAADTVSDICCVKHAFRQGIPAMNGVEK